MAVDSIGNFSFRNVNNGSYVLYAVADSLLYPKALGTYYKNADRWINADIKLVNGCKIVYSGVNIDLQEFHTNPVGKGKIRGKTYRKLQTSTRKAIKDVEITLQKIPPLKSVARVVTDTNGFYEFDKLSDGNYQLIIDIPGLQMDSVIKITLTPQDSFF